MPDANQYEDFLFSFEAGVNSGVEAVLLLKNQLAWAENATVRGGYITHRPPLKRQTLDFGTPIDQALQTLVLTGRFQGATVYRPDGEVSSQIIAQIGGHLISFTPVGNQWVVSDISVVGDLNDATAPQVWMWQAEKWLIVNDGTGKLPLFYDGTTTRRSYGDSVVLGTLGANFTPPNPRVIGETNSLTLAANWTHGFGQRILFNGEYYDVQGTTVLPNPPNAILQLESGSAGPFPINTDVVSNPNILGVMTAATTPVISGYATISSTFVIGHANPSVGINTRFTAGYANIWYVETIISPTSFIARSSLGYGLPGTIPAGTKLLFYPPTAPSVSIGKLTTVYTATGLQDNLVLTTAYTGQDDALVTIGTSYFRIWKYPSGATVQLNLVNVTDTKIATVTAGTDAANLMSVPELPAGRVGEYGMGRNWVSLIDGISFVAGDIVGGASGSAAYDYRDAVLRTTENTFLEGGGTFRLPGSGDFINSMTFSANLDASFGQGPLQVGTLQGVFSCQTPVNRADWLAVTNPLLCESMIGNGPTAQDSTLVANSDILFRIVEGVGSLIQGRRGFSEWGNKGISYEMRRLFRNDDRSLLTFGSSVVHDNRFLTTANPTNSGVSVVHPYTAVLNFDTISSLTASAPPVWEGTWNIPGLLKWIQGNFGNNLRSFMFALDTNNQIELYELLRSEDQHHDNIADRIVWSYETAMLFNKDIKPPAEIVNLLNGEIYIKDVTGTVDFTVLYRPDFHPTWIPWTGFSITADPTSLTGYRTPLGFGKPTIDGTAENANNRSFPNGHFFQVRVEITGDCKVTAMRFACSKIPKTPFVPPVANTANPVQLITSAGQDLPMP